jgi:hypothetical protein
MRMTSSGDIVNATSAVAQFTISSKLTDLQIQFAEGAP